MSDGPFAGRGAGSSLLSLTRPQGVALGVAAVGAVGWLAVPTHPWALLACVPVVASLAIGADGRSPADHAATALSFLGRSRWTYASVEVVPHGWSTTARGRATCAAHVLEHVGRWDLSGRDDDVAGDLARLLDERASEDSRHVSWHLLGEVDPPVTLLCAPAGATVPKVAARAPRDLAARLIPGCGARGWLYERWRYVRTEGAVSATFALRSVSASSARTRLGALAPVGSRRTLSVHVRVVADRAARAVVGRHAHRLRADLAVASLAGFRRRASAEAATTTLEARERDVAAGHALAHVAVFVTVAAPTRGALERAVTVLRADARRVGAVLERGNGRHAEWLCASLPGSPSWRS